MNTLKVLAVIFISLFVALAFSFLRSTAENETNAQWMEAYYRECLSRVAFDGITPEERDGCREVYLTPVEN